MIATAPGKLILTGEYAVLEGAPALVVAVDRRVTARVRRPGGPRAAGSSPFLVAVAAELARSGHPDAARIALDVEVDSSALFQGTTKLGLGSSAAVTVAATALALALPGSEDDRLDPARLDRELVARIAAAAHASAQGARGTPGSGADIAAAIHGGTIVFTAGRSEPRRWPRAVHLLPFFTGVAADTRALVGAVHQARVDHAEAVDAALAAIEAASRATCAALTAPAELVATGMIGALALAGTAIDRLEAATGLALVPPSVRAARAALAPLGGTAKTTGAGGGDVAVGVIPGTQDVTTATRALIEAGCQPLQLTVDETGVDLRPTAS